MRGPVSSSCGSATRLFSAVFQPVRAAHHRRPAHNSSATVSSAEDENHDDNDCNHGDHHRDQSLRNRTTCNFEQIEDMFTTHCPQSEPVLGETYAVNMWMVIDHSTPGLMMESAFYADWPYMVVDV